MHPGEIHGVEQFVEALDAARRRAARGTGRRQVSITDLARRTGIPRSTVHVYLTGRTLPPSDALDALLQALGVDGADLRAWADALERLSARPAAAAEPGPPVPRQLPLVPRDVVGREEEFAALDRLLAAAADDGTPLVVVLSGLGGVGKSTVASTWAADHEDEFPDGTLWIDLHGFGLQSPLGVGAALARLLVALGQPAGALPADTETRADLFRSLTHGRRLLLVLDNAADSEQVRLLLPGTAGCTVLVTSRSELRTLVSETGASRVRVGGLDDGAGVELLHRGAGPALPETLARRVVAHCGGLPLALRVVRERLAGRPLDDVADFVKQLDDRRSRLAALEWSEGTVDTGIRPVLHASYTALTADAATTFRALPLCLGRTIDLVDVATCLDLPALDTRRRLDELVAANLLTEVALDRYALADLVAGYADELAREDTDTRTAQDRRLSASLLARARAACAAVAPTWDSAVPLLPVEAADEAGLSVADGTEWLTAHTDLLVAVALRCLERGEVTPAWVMLGTMARALLYRADVSALLSPLEAVADAADRGGELASAATVWRAAGAVATCADRSRAGPAYRRGLAAALAEDSETEQVLARRNLAYLDLLAGAPTSALVHLDAVAASFDRRDEPVPMHALLLIAAAHGMRGDTDRAAGFVHAAIAAAEAAGQPDSAAMCHLDLAWLAQEADRPAEEVLDHARRARIRVDEVDPHHDLHEPSSYEVRALLDLGRTDEAAQLLSHRHGRSRASSRDDVALDVEQGVLLLRTGRAGAAVAHLAATVAYAGEAEMWWEYTSALQELAAARLATGDVEGAARAVDEGSQLCAERGYELRAARFAALREGLSARAHPA